MRRRALRTRSRSNHFGCWVKISLSIATGKGVTGSSVSSARIAAPRSAFGRVDEEGIRCPYHGWKFDCTGKCLEQPAEQASGASKTRSSTQRIPWNKWAAYYGHI